MRLNNSDFVFEDEFKVITHHKENDSIGKVESAGSAAFDTAKDEELTQRYENSAILKAKNELVKILDEIENLNHNPRDRPATDQHGTEFRDRREDMRFRPGPTHLTGTHDSFVVSCHSSDVNDTKD